MKGLIVLLILLLTQTSASAHGKHFSADSLLLVGTSYYKSERYLDALDVLAKAMEAADRTGNDKAYIEALLTIGNTYCIFCDYQQALHCYSTSMKKIAGQASDSILYKVKCNMLMCYAMLGKTKEAEDCYKSIGTLHLGDNDKNRFYTYLNQAHLSMARKYYKGAIFFHTLAMKYAMSHNMSGLYTAAEMGQIGTMHEKDGNMKEAEEWYKKCYDYAVKGHFVGPMTTACERLADLYRKQGNDKLSMKYNKLFVEYTDSFFKQKDYNSKRSLISEYESRQSDRRISQLKGWNTALLWVTVTIATLLVALILLLVYIFRVNRRLANTQRLLIKKHQEHSHQLEVQNEIFTSMENVRTNNADEMHGNQSSDDGQNPSDSDDAGEQLLTKTQADMLLIAITQAMEDSDMVCDTEFCLNTLAQKVNSNTKYVSWVINKNYGKNFKTYLNEYRIRKASQILADAGQIANLTIAGIAERVGYKSPASFHLAFKKIYGMTPAAYVKLVRERQNE